MWNNITYFNHDKDKKNHFLKMLLDFNLLVNYEFSNTCLQLTKAQLSKLLYGSAKLQYIVQLGSI